MLCFHCGRQAHFSFRWPWGATALGVCTTDRDMVAKKARAAAARTPELTPIDNPLPDDAPPPAALGELEQSTAPAARLAQNASSEPPTLPDVPPPRLEHDVPKQGPTDLALVRLYRNGEESLFMLRRPGQHDVEGTADELVPILQALKLIPEPKQPPPAARRGAPGAPVSAFSHPSQVTPPTAAAALAGAVSGPPSARGERAPVNPPLRGMAITPVRGVAARPLPPLGAMGSVSAVPGNPPPAPPPVMPPGAPVSSEGQPAGESVVEGGAEPAAR